MKKITKVLFVTEDIEIQKSNIEHKVDAPVSVGKIELPAQKIRKATSASGGLQPKFWENFPISEWSFYLSLVNAANKKLGCIAVTLSKKAYVDGKLDPNHGSIWFSCGSKDFKDYFKRPLFIAIAEKGLRKINKAQIKKMESGTEFEIIFVSESLNIDSIEVIKFGDDKKINYHFPGEKDIFSIAYENIREDGSGTQELEDGKKEDFYFYVSESMENI